MSNPFSFSFMSPPQSISPSRSSRTWSCPRQAGPRPTGCSPAQVYKVYRQILDYLYRAPDTPPAGSGHRSYPDATCVPVDCPSPFGNKTPARPLRPGGRLNQMHSGAMEQGNNEGIVEGKYLLRFTVLVSGCHKIRWVTMNQLATTPQQWPER